MNLVGGGDTIQPTPPHHLCGFQQASDFHIPMIKGTDTHPKGKEVPGTTQSVRQSTLRDTSLPADF